MSDRSKLPQKRFYRQRAHSNPIADHDIEYPVSPDKMDWGKHYPDFSQTNPVVFADIGCGYGGLLIELSKLFPQKLAVGFELRVKVSDYVMDRIAALRSEQPGQFDNIACIRTNAMKYMPNYFSKGQLLKMFFLFPDPHFKKAKHKWRIISQTLLDEYAYVLKEGAIVYTITDVFEVHEWIENHFKEHPLFEEVPNDEKEMDPVIPLLSESTEEGKKVTREGRLKWTAVFRRVSNLQKPALTITSTS